MMTFLTIEKNNPTITVYLQFKSDMGHHLQLLLDVYNGENVRDFCWLKEVSACTSLLNWVCDWSRKKSCFFDHLDSLRLYLNLGKNSKCSPVDTCAPKRRKYIWYLLILQMIFEEVQVHKTCFDILVVAHFQVLLGRTKCWRSPAANMSGHKASRGWQCRGQ